MTAYPFVPSASTPFQFQPVLDGATYNVVVTWNVFGQRWYVNAFDLAGNRIVTIPVIASPSTIDLQAISWASGRAAGVVVAPHGLPVGATARLTVSGCSPSGYDGTFDVLASGADSFSYALAANPGVATVLGSAGYSINILAGYFASTLVFREASSTFEVSP